MELEGGEIVEFDVLGTKKDEPTKNKDELAKDVKNEGGDENTNTQTRKYGGNVGETLTPKGKIKSSTRYQQPYKVRNMVVFPVLFTQKVFPYKKLEFGYNNA